MEVGRNLAVKREYFKKSTEGGIVDILSKFFYVKDSGEPIVIRGKSTSYCIISLPEKFKKLFCLEKDLICLISSSKSLEYDILDSLQTIKFRHGSRFIEEICCLLISEDHSIEDNITKYISTNTESKVVIPFQFDEIFQNKEKIDFIENRFRKYFFTRDLFAARNPLKTDTYFFGRNDVIRDVIGKFKAGQNAGLFGLRKTGKTSIIFGIQRALKREGFVTQFIDCQHTGFNQKKWNFALKYIIDVLKHENKIKYKDNYRVEQKYSVENAGWSFEEEINKISNRLGQRRIILLFDEIEWLTPGVTTIQHWRKGNDYTSFWQTLRAINQNQANKGILSYLIAGTNPTCVEKSYINLMDNPIFEQIPSNYIPPFNVQKTKDMVYNLGRIMGLRFDDIIFSKLTDDFGGHPFLIRNFCSTINSIANKHRPVRIDKHIYELAKQEFVIHKSDYIEMILNVLKQHYTEEYEMLEFLALDDVHTFNGLANEAPEMVDHLLSYNIIDKNEGNYFFKIELIKEYLKNKNKYRKLNLTISEKWQEISERRNDLEVKLRRIIQMQFKASIGKIEGKRVIMEVFGYPRKKRFSDLSFSELFDPIEGEIYFRDLKRIVIEKWDLFKGIFKNKRSYFITCMDIVNKFRNDAHAKEIIEEDFHHFRISITFLENSVKDFFEN